MKTAEIAKRCECCGQTMKRRETESRNNFEKRKGCSVRCSAIIRRRDQSTREVIISEAVSRLASVFGYNNIEPTKGRVFTAEKLKKLIKTDHKLRRVSHGVQSGMQLF